MCDNQKPDELPYQRQINTRIKDALADAEERRLLIWGTLCLSVLGVIAFLITGQVGVVVAMNAPLLAIIGKDIFAKNNASTT